MPLAIHSDVVLHAPVPVVLLHVDAGLLAVDDAGGEVMAVVTKEVGAVVAYSVWVLPPDLSEVHVSHLVLTWLSHAAPIADT